MLLYLAVSIRWISIRFDSCFIHLKTSKRISAVILYHSLPINPIQGGIPSPLPPYTLPPPSIHLQKLFKRLHIAQECLDY